jgi:hypothetical protein
MMGTLSHHHQPADSDSVSSAGADGAVAAKDGKVKGSVGADGKPRGRPPVAVAETGLKILYSNEHGCYYTDKGYYWHGNKAGWKPTPPPQQQPQADVAEPDFSVPLDNAMKVELNGCAEPASDSADPAAAGAAAPAKREARERLFVDDTIASFFRRLAWSPDGSFAVAPAGIMPGAPNRYCSYVLPRRALTRPLAQLQCGPKPSVVVRFNPVVFELLAKPAANTGCDASEPAVASAAEASTSQPVEDAGAVPGSEGVVGPFNLGHRVIFAVGTLDSVFIYDTQAWGAPIALLTGLHYAPLTDLAWSSDGRTLVVSSSDGCVRGCARAAS